MNKKSVLFSVATFLALGVTLSSCLDDENPTVTSTITQLSATLTGAGEKPNPVPSTATGNFTGKLNTVSRVLSYTVTYQGLNPTGGHLHKIVNADGTGPVDIPFPSLTSPIIATTAPLRQTQVDSLLAGQYYANLHTAAYKGGEIRGEVRKK
ncbi:CHRD domain-containing protein [Spirosoma sp.]|uniref:CHRD domain-containing protein n=1 Tax=Spirosoma sp. TaxID=1899569 RepID=UPI00260ABE95|nr:CHRD domain-containing protein [Spirosoma sp.]MCX6216283.1 CHRD domain-containing protein [Spirosoma sp.]